MQRDSKDARPGSSGWGPAEASAGFLRHPGRQGRTVPGPCDHTVPGIVPREARGCPTPASTPASQPRRSSHRELADVIWNCRTPVHRRARPLPRRGDGTQFVPCYTRRLKKRARPQRSCLHRFIGGVTPSQHPLTTPLAIATRLVHGADIVRESAAGILMVP